MGVDGPGGDVFFLDEDVFAGGVCAGRVCRHRTSIARSAERGVGGCVDVDACFDGLIGEPADRAADWSAADAAGCGGVVGEVADDVEVLPRRAVLGDCSDEMLDVRKAGCRVVRADGVRDERDEVAVVDADGRCFGGRLARRSSGPIPDLAARVSAATSRSMAERMSSGASLPCLSYASRRRASSRRSLQLASRTTR